ncbi:MAG: pyrimidine operon attenuation protein/uracil phosphoribosyltransferase [Marivirga sp.]|jgi:pyrimidine operon attenuation protein/uracil phosphoribosyltransferase
MSDSLLTKTQIEGKIKRIAYQILENNYKEKEIYLGGIKGGGYIFATKIKVEYDKIADFPIALIEVSIDKTNPLSSPVQLDREVSVPVEAVVIMVDDVLNSGRTFMYALKPFLSLPLKKIESAFLVNRSHRLFPVSAKYTGIELATTLQEHIRVSWETDDFGVYLK